MTSVPDPIVPASVSMHDGAPHSTQFGDVYFSTESGIEETRHVFLSGNDLPQRWQACGRFTIVETGFGTGLNFLATWQAFRDSAPHDARLHFVSVEKHPLRHADLQRVQAQWPQFRDLSNALLDCYPLLTPGFHHLHFEGGRVSLTLLFGEAVEMLSELDATADAFYLDGFAPARNPEMWSPALCMQLARLAAPGASVATYSVAGTVKRALAQAGFAVEKRPGYARKREMLTARFPGNWRASPMLATRVAVIGAGIAGTSAALALARSGLAIDLYEEMPSPARATSANPAGLVRPFLSLEQGARNRFTWAAHEYAVRHYDALARLTDGMWDRSGVLQLPRNSAHGDKLQRALAQSAHAMAQATWVSENEAAELAGARVAGAGVWFSNAGRLSGRAACSAGLRAAGERISLHASTRIVDVEAGGDGFLLRGVDNATVASADCVVFANGYRARQFSLCAGVELRPVRGQLTLIPRRVPGLRAPVCREGYVTPAIDGWHIAGATYDEGAADASLRTEDDSENIARVQTMLPGAFDAVDPASVRSWAGVRCASRDRSPLLGPLAPGVYAMLALGSRGFTWAPLAAELVAAHITGAPLPVDQGQATAFSASRFSKFAR
ncbi:MAG: bifunctional tRNA (5-methylaminomethyl-2-thiouridine)(34)-methyltransferase MnmD/FAD-dependent 5-carboxymethylaminomethyl-2-thiouridine(34) oxidoreductase MnmC [Burkholderiales bacterium]